MANRNSSTPLRTISINTVDLTGSSPRLISSSKPSAKYAGIQNTPVRKAGNHFFMSEKSITIQKRKPSTPPRYRQTVLPFSQPDKLLACSMRLAKAHFKGKNVDEFLVYVSGLLTPELCSEIEQKTRDQSKSSLWYKLRCGRITASIIYRARLENKPYAGYLCKTIMSDSPQTSPFRGNAATERGKRLESRVLMALTKKLEKTIYRCGFILHKDYPAFGASPDGIADDFVVEIKCPTTESTVSKYYNSEKNSITKTYESQLQLQIAMCKKNFGYFCIADPNFENNEKITVLKVDANPEGVQELMASALNGWKKNIYPLI